MNFLRPSVSSFTMPSKTQAVIAAVADSLFGTTFRMQNVIHKRRRIEQPFLNHLPAFCIKEFVKQLRSILLTKSFSHCLRFSLSATRDSARDTQVASTGPTMLSASSSDSGASFCQLRSSMFRRRYPPPPIFMAHFAFWALISLYGRMRHW